MRLRSCRCVAVAATLCMTLLPTGFRNASCRDTSGRLGDRIEREKSKGGAVNIVFLHHSTGERIWLGGVPEWFDAYNRRNGTKYHIVEQAFPKQSPYGWNNYPYDYWNIWVNHAGQIPYQEEPTLELLTKSYDVIIFKHCFPVCQTIADTGSPNVASPEKKLENYRLQYEALKVKMHEFPKTTFIVWTGAAEVDYSNLLHKMVALIRGRSGVKERAKRARTFFEWVRNDWDEPGDNIYVWDFYGLETGGGLFMKKEFADGPTNSHPNRTFSKMAAARFCQRVVDVIEGRGDRTNVTAKENAPLNAPRR
jgi:hypothetical protein